MREIKFRVWHRKDKKMYYCGYQKLTHILVCEDDLGKKEGKGIPVKRASFDDCEMLEGTGVLDLHGREIFEGDVVKIKATDRSFEGVVGSVPDMFRSRRLHPLQGLLEEHGLLGQVDGLTFEVIGNRFEFSRL